MDDGPIDHAEDVERSYTDAASTIGSPIQLTVSTDDLPVLADTTSLSSRRPSLQEIFGEESSRLQIERCRQWVYAFVVVNFDLENGQGACVAEFMFSSPSQLYRN